MSTKLTKRAFITILPLIFIFINCSEDKSTNPIDPTKCQMVVYRNGINKLTIIDYNTYEVVKHINVNIPDTLQFHSMCLSTNKDYFIFCASTGAPPFSNYIISYDIVKNSVYNIFPTGLDSVGAPRMTAAFLPDEPGLIYLYTRHVGLYAIDFLKEEKELISPEKGMSKDFFHSHDKKWILMNKYIPCGDYTEIEFYNTSERLYQEEFILNKNDQDSLDVVDLVFSKNKTKLYISYLLSKRRAVYDAAFFGCYDLETKEPDSSYVTLPWSDNPYYIAYSSKRQEVYMVGAQDKFYIIDVSSKEYSIEAVIDLTGKIPSPSRIVIRPDEDVAFVSCVYTDLVFVIDLENRRILKSIQIEHPYFMVLL